MRLRTRGNLWESIWNCSDIREACEDVAALISCCEMVMAIPIAVAEQKAYCPYIDAITAVFGQQSYEAAAEAVESLCDASDVATLCATPVRTYVDNVRTLVEAESCCGTTAPDVCAGTYEALFMDDDDGAGSVPTEPEAARTTTAPTDAPTDSPTGAPTTAEPTAAPSLAPTFAPSQAPTIATEDVRASPFPHVLCELETRHVMSGGKIVKIAC